jgi:tetratricopeptide (TPR) repeat protein
LCGKALGNLGEAYQNLGHYAKAIEYEQQLLAIAQAFCRFALIPQPCGGEVQMEQLYENLQSSLQTLTR